MLLGPQDVDDCSLEILSSTSMWVNGRRNIEFSCLLSRKSIGDSVVFGIRLEYTRIARSAAL